MYKEYSDTVSIFENNGEVKPFGWSKEPVFFYNKINSSAKTFRTKESDTYIIQNKHIILSVSLANFGMYSIVSGFLIDLDNFKISKKVIKKMLPLTKLKMPETSISGDIAYNDSQIGIKFSKAGTKRFLKCDFLDFYNSKNLYFNIELEENNNESMNVIVPLEGNKSRFFLKRLIPQMKAKGLVRFGGYEYDLDNEPTIGTLIWERNSIKAKIKHQQLFSTGFIKNKPVTIQICNGLTDKSNGIENALIINGKVKKLSDVKIKGDFNDIHSPWKFEDNERNIYLEFIPSANGGGKLTTEVENRRIVYGNVYGHIFDENGEVTKINGFDGLITNSTI